MTTRNDRNPREAWERFTSTHVVGDALRGRVTSIVNFGAFVEVAPDVEGLLHVSHYDEAPALNALVDVKIDALDAEQRRLSLAPA